MGSEVKLGLAAMAAVTLLLCGLIGHCSYADKLHSEAPIVETCVKHPATKLPFGNVGSR